MALAGKRKPKPAVKAAYHHGNLREALVAAGLRYLESARRGDELSLRELARRVGVTANAVYRHFADKDALLSALAAEGFRLLRAAQLAAAEGAGQPKLTLKAAGRAYLEFAHGHPALYRLMFGQYAAAHHGGELAEAARSSFQVLLDQVAAARSLQPGDGQVLAGAVHSWGLVHGLSQFWIDGQLDALSDDPAALIESAMQFAVSTPKAGAKG